MEKKDLIKVVIAGVLILVAVVMAVRYFAGGSEPAVAPDGQVLPSQPRLKLN